MSLWAKIVSRLRMLGGRRRFERELEEELRFHQEMQQEAERRAGLTPDEATRAAKRQFGGLDQIKEQIRDEHDWTRLHVCLKDFHHAARLLLKHRTYSVFVVGILGVAIGANAVVFAFCDALFSGRLPLPRADRLVSLDERSEVWQLRYAGLSRFDFDLWSRSSRSFEAMAAWQSRSANLAAPGVVRRVACLCWSGEVAGTLAVAPALGRMLQRSDAAPGAPRVALLSNRFWSEAFGRDPAILGRRITLDGRPHEVVGVLPPEAVFPGDVPVWVMDDSTSGGWYLSALARLRDGVDLSEAQAELSALHRSIGNRRHEHASVTWPVIETLGARYLGDARRTGTLVQGAVLVVLLIAVVNTAGLTLARTAARRGEWAMRAALGASRGAIARLIVFESILLAVAAGLLGACLAWMLLAGPLRAGEAKLPSWVFVRVDLAFVLFVTGLSAVVAALSGLIGVRHALRQTDLRALLASGAQSSVATRAFGPLRVLVLLQTALAVLLMIVSGAFLQALTSLQRTDLGYQVENAWRYDVVLPRDGFTRPEASRAFFERHLTAVRKLPGVLSAGGSSLLPLEGSRNNFFEPEHESRSHDRASPVLQRYVFPGYFATMGIQVAAGRAFTDEDGRDETSLVAVIDEELAREFWPRGGAVGRRIRMRWHERAPWITVVGVARDVRQLGAELEGRPGLYLPWRQAQWMDALEFPPPALSVVLRVAPGMTPDQAAVQAALREQDSALSASELTPLSRAVSESLWMRRAYSGLLAVFGCSALLLALSGVFGVTSYVTHLRIREIGVRQALGASSGAVFRMLLREGLWLAGWGMVIGVSGGFGIAYWLRSHLGGTFPGHLPYHLGVMGAVGTMLVLACAGPAVRACRVNPADILRCE